MRDTETMIEKDHENNAHQAWDAADRPSTGPLNVIQAYASPTIPVVAAFTPINRNYSPVPPEDDNPASVSASRANKGKIRQKKASAPTTTTPKPKKTPRPRQPKKAKPAAASKEQSIAHTFTVSKPLNRKIPVYERISNETALEPSVQVHQSSVTAIPGQPLRQKSLQACEAWPSVGGLSSTYRGAFRQKVLPTVTDGGNGYLPSIYLAGEDTYTVPRSPSSQPALPLASVRTEQLDLLDDPASAIDFSVFENFLTLSAETDCSPMDVSETMGQVSEFECTSKRDVVPETSPESILSSDASFPFSDIDHLLSPYDNQLVDLSERQPLIESSSPCLRSYLGHQPVSNHEASPNIFMPDNHSSDEDIFDDEEIETAFFGFQSPTSAQVPPPSPPTSPNQKRIAKTQWTPPDPITPATSPVKEEAPSSPLITVSPPALPNKCSGDIPHKISFDQNGTAIPFIRPVFPNPVRDRSPIHGLSSRTLLRTCFRIGEALNAGSTALRTRTDAVMELYARVSYSDRPAGSVKQYFQLADIFSPDKPPFLKGTYGLWKGVGIWDLDSKVFLGSEGKGKMARVVGRIGREEKTRGLEMTVLSVWEVDWEDVGICKGHFCG
ncbi:MAG: hypothetical protein Q9171_003121 [Xanthocarpia ochracea]